MTDDPDVLSAHRRMRLSDRMSPMRWISDDLKSWLSPTRTSNGTYKHSRIDESATGRQAGLEALGDLVVEAHADAVARLEALAAIDLHPLAH